MVCAIRMFDHFYVPFFAYRLNLAVGDVFKLESIHTETEEADLENHLNSCLSLLFKKCRKFFGTFRHSSFNTTTEN